MGDKDHAAVLARKLASMFPNPAKRQEVVQLARPYSWKLTESENQLLVEADREQYEAWKRH